MARTFSIATALTPALALFGCGGGSADPGPPPPLTLRVPADHPSISAAIAAAPNGYTILISKGSYSGSQNTNLNLRNSRLQLRGEGGPDGVVIDCRGLTRFMTFDNAEGSDVSVSSLTIRNCNIDFNGAIYVLNSAPTIVGNVFETTLANSAWLGPAVFGFSGSSRIEKNIFRGIACDDQFNSAVLSFVNSSDTYIANNVFVDNPCRAVAMTLPEGVAPVVVNNTMIRNRAGIYVYRAVSTAAHRYSNNLIAFNQRGLEVDFEFQPRGDSFSDSWQNNLVFANATDYLGTADLSGIQGNLRVDPLLVSSTNPRLTATSPAKDAGTSANAPLDDFDGRRRSAPVDIGAFELP